LGFSAQGEFAVAVSSARRVADVFTIGAELLIVKRIIALVIAAKPRSKLLFMTKATANCGI
jgi:hypothetical protein